MSLPYALSPIESPDSEPVSVPLARLACRLDAYDNSQDELLILYISAARRYVEQVTSRFLVSQTWLFAIDSFYSRLQWWGVDMFRVPMPQENAGANPFGGQVYPYSVIYIPKPPLLSIVSLDYIDSTTEENTTLDPSQYIVDTFSEWGRITPAYGTVWPVPLAVPLAVKITFTAGYGGPLAVPPTIKTAILMLVAHYFAHRLAVSDAAGSEVPLGVKSLLGSEDFGGYV